MAKITSRTLLNVGTEIIVDESTLTIQLLPAGNLVAKDGVTFQAVYSKMVNLWATESYQDSPFPMYAIDALSGQFQIGTDGASFNGWTWADDATRNMLRDGGWSEFDASGNKTQEFSGFVGLGAINSGAQPYYILDTTDAPTDFPFADQFNAGIKVFGDASNGAFDKRAYAKAFVREQGKKYKDSILSDTGKTATGAFLVNFLISNEDDLKISDLDAEMVNAPYNGITVSYYTLDQTRNIGGTDYNFKTIIEGNGATLEQIYTKIQYLLRQNSDINTSGTAGVVTGKTAKSLLAFVGETLVTSQSVFIDNIQAADANRIEFYDDSGALRTNPYTASWVITANTPLRGTGSAYRMLFVTGPGTGDDYGESGAITVKDASGFDIAGEIPSNGIINGTFDYDGDTLGGTAATDKDIIVVGIRPGSGKFVAATGTLSRAKGITIALVAEQDRVYA